MARGRRPAPAGIQSQKAAVRSRRKTPAAKASDLAPGSLVAPAWLKDDGLKLWARLAPTLQQAKLLSQADVETFGRYCRNFARWLKMQTALDGDGETYSVETASGLVHRPRPEFLIADRLERQLLAAEDRFGLNPAERQRIMAARAQTGVSGDLFGADQPAKREGDPATPPAEAAAPIHGPIGLLN